MEKTAKGGSRARCVTGNSLEVELYKKPRWARVADKEFESGGLSATSFEAARNMRHLTGGFRARGRAERFERVEGRKAETEGLRKC